MNRRGFLLAIPAVAVAAASARPKLWSAAGTGPVGWPRRIGLGPGRTWRVQHLESGKWLDGTDWQWKDAPVENVVPLREPDGSLYVGSENTR